MNLSDENIKLITRYSAAFMSPGEIAVALGVDIAEFVAEIRKENSPAFRAYHLAKIEQKLNLREKVIKMASFGSNSAETIVESYIIEQSKKERDGKI